MDNIKCLLKTIKNQVKEKMNKKFKVSEKNDNACLSKHKAQHCVTTVCSLLWRRGGTLCFKAVVNEAVIKCLLKKLNKKSP